MFLQGVGTLAGLVLCCGVLHEVVQPGSNKQQRARKMEIDRITMQNVQSAAKAKQIPMHPTGYDDIEPKRQPQHPPSYQTATTRPRSNGHVNDSFDSYEYDSTPPANNKGRYANVDSASDTII